MNIIIGAGMSGLTAARYLEGDFLVLEKEMSPGGLGTQYKAGDYWFDYSGHYFHFKDKEEIQTIVESVCAFKKFDRDSKTYVMDRLVPFPLQFHLAYLPLYKRNQIWDEIRRSPFVPADNLFDYLEKNFGGSLFNLFFKPFLEKYYGIHLRRIMSQMDRGSIPPPDKQRIREGLENRKAVTAGYNPVFYYPRTSLRDFIRKYTAGIDAGRLHTGETVIAVDMQKKRVITSRREYPYETLISTMPLKELVRIIRPRDRFPRPDEFRHTSTLLVNVILRKRRKPFHWVYVAEPSIPFYRVGIYPVHKHPACYLERTVPPGFQADRDTVRREVIATLQQLKLIMEPEELVFMDVRVLPVSYVLFTKNWPDVVPPTLAKLKEQGIYSIGRFGSWNYSSMADDIRDALACAREINKKTV